MTPEWAARGSHISGGLCIILGLVVGILFVRPETISLMFAGFMLSGLGTIVTKSAIKKDPILTESGKNLQRGMGLLEAGIIVLVSAGIYGPLLRTDFTAVFYIPFVIGMVVSLAGLFLVRIKPSSHSDMV